MRNDPRDGLLFVLTMIGIGIAALCITTSVRGQEYTEPYRAVCELSVPGLGQGSGTLIAVREDLGLGIGLSCRHVCRKPYQEMTADWIWAGCGKTKAVTLAVIDGRGFDTDMAVFVTEIPRGVKPVPVVTFNEDEGPWIAAGYRDNLLRVAGPTPRVNYNGRTIATKYLAGEPGGHVFVGGMSGGPLFNSWGEIVGVVVASDDKTMSLCSDGPALKALVDRFLAAKAVSDLDALTSE